MADRSAIEWTDSTWNPVTGCTKVSTGCDHCYAETFAERWRGIPGHPYEQGFDVRLWPDRLDIPLRWTKPRRVFVNSMADLFHDQVPDEFIAQVFDVMALAPQHTFQVLTKRPGRMASLLNSATFRHAVLRAGQDRAGDQQQWLQAAAMLSDPLPNVWVGVSVEDQRWADLRIPKLLETPAAIRFISAEPLLGPVDLTPWLGAVEPPRLDWVICGGESGPAGRPMHPDWARDLRDRCRTAGVPFHFKQHGAWRDVGMHETEPDPQIAMWTCGKQQPYSAGAAAWRREHLRHLEHGCRGGFFARVGKKAAGRELDGRTWDEQPDLARTT